MWYSPWQHQGTDNTLIPLLLEIQAQFSTWLKLKEKSKDFNRRGGLAALALFERVTDAAISLTFQKNMKIAQGSTKSVRKAWNQFRGYENDSTNFARKFILFHYLRMFHRPVWHLLERQPKSLMLLYRVLNNDPERLPEDEGFQYDDQRMLREFLHVLRDDTTHKDNTRRKLDEDIPKYHRNIDLSQAVQLFQERQDSKRSDEFFIEQFSMVVEPDRKLEDKFLYLPDKKTRRKIHHHLICPVRNAN